LPAPILIQMVDRKFLKGPCEIFHLRVKIVRVCAVGSCGLGDIYLSALYLAL
jgi:hypothetical protein